MPHNWPERARIADEILAIGIPSHLTRDPLFAPARGHSRLVGVAVSLVALALAGTALAAVLGGSIRGRGETSPATFVPTRALSASPATYASEPAPVLMSIAEPVPMCIGIAEPEPTIANEAVAPDPSMRRRASRPNALRLLATALEARGRRRGGSPVAIDGSLDALLDRALGPRDGAPPGASRLDGLREMPTQYEVGRTLRALTPDVRACVAGEGVVRTNITIEGRTGRVTATAPEGLGETERACIERVLETARFSAFARDRFELAFPYPLN